ncbi:MAG: hypothetical protein K0S70_2090, partial [Microbacterium sp.]|nr:hypothetical protein [Microbacterium sp.]
RTPMTSLSVYANAAEAAAAMASGNAGAAASSAQAAELARLNAVAAQAAAVEAAAEAAAVGNTNDTITEALIKSPGSKTATALGTVIAGQAQDASSPLGVVLRDPIAQRDVDAQIEALLTEATLNAAKYAMTWITTTYPGTGTITDFGGLTETNIRIPANAAFTLGALIRRGKFDPTVVGATEAAARVQIVRLVTSLTAKHFANNGGTGWGGPQNIGPGTAGNQQYTLWAYLISSAAWMVWDSISTAGQNAIIAMVVWEANRMRPSIWGPTVIPYWKDRAGNEVALGDSKSEETAWHAPVVIMAMLMQPNHANYGEWWRSLINMGISYNAIPADLSDTTPVNGVIPATFLNGTNVNPDGTVVNHTRIHPNYMVSPASSLYGSFAFAWDAGLALPMALTRHAELIYDALLNVDFTVGTFGPHPYPAGGRILAPGGTIYKWPGTADIYYPQGTDHQLPRVEDKAIYDVCAYVYGWDRGQNPGAGYWAIQHLTRQLELQARFTTGQTYTTGENGSVGAEMVVAANLAHGLLTATAPAEKFTHEPVIDRTNLSTAIASIDPLVWWKLDEAAGTAIADASGAGHAATLSGTAPTYRAGSIVPSEPDDKSMHVAGGTLVMQNSYGQGWIQGYFTAGCVVKMAANPASEVSIVGRNSSKTGQQNGGVAWSLQVKTNGTIHLLAYDTAFVLREVGPNAVSIANGQPHLITWTADATGVSLYLDGALVGKWTGEYNRNSTANLHALGRDTPGGITQGMTGQVSDVFQTPTLLSAAGHADLYQAFLAD